jgi:hypothetical protein
MTELVETAPGRWRVKRKCAISNAQMRSDLPMPYVISDIMEPTEQVNGVFYTSKSAFRKVGRSLGLTEIGNEKLPPRNRSQLFAGEKRKRREAIAQSIEKYKAGHRVTQKR